MSGSYCAMPAPCTVRFEEPVENLIKNKEHIDIVWRRRIRDECPKHDKSNQMHAEASTAEKIVLHRTFSALFAAAIPRLLDRDTLTSPNSTKLSAIGLDVLMGNVSSEGRKTPRNHDTRRDNRLALTYPERLLWRAGLCREPARTLEKCRQQVS